MTERTQLILYIVAGTFGLTVALLVFAILHRRHLDRISQAIADLPPAPEGTARILQAIEGARMQISSTGDELRGQHVIIKERTNWLIHQYDRLIAMLKKVITPQERP